MCSTQESALPVAAAAVQHLILGWCVSQRDLEVVRKMLQQICVAYAPEGGTKVRRNGSCSSSSNCSSSAGWAHTAD
jgi:hypothetical protein